MLEGVFMLVRKDNVSRSISTVTGGARQHTTPTPSLTPNFMISLG